jgi:hypothetical protein
MALRSNTALLSLSLHIISYLRRYLFGTIVVLGLSLAPLIAMTLRNTIAILFLLFSPSASRIRVDVSFHTIAVLGPCLAPMIDMALRSSRAVLSFLLPSAFRTFSRMTIIAAGSFLAPSTDMTLRSSRTVLSSLLPSASRI